MREDVFLDDIAPVWDDELSDAQWFEVAQAEYWLGFGSNRRRSCNHSLGPKCHCRRLQSHHGPHIGMRLEMKMTSVDDDNTFSQYWSAEIIRTYPLVIVEDSPPTEFVTRSRLK